MYKGKKQGNTMPKRKDIFENPDDTYDRISFNYADIKLKIIKELCSRTMTFEDIRKEMSLFPKYKGRDDTNKPIHDRTVIRLIQSIQNSFRDEFDIPSGSTWKDQTYKLNLFSFPETMTQDELDALDAAVNGTKNKTFNKKLQTLHTKIFNKWMLHKNALEQDNAQYKLEKLNAATMGPQLQTSVKTEIYQKLTEAIINQEKIIITYKNKRDEIKDHKICPLGFIYGPNDVYLALFYCTKDNTILPDVSTWPLSNIMATKNITGEETWFSTASFDLKKYANSMFGIPFDEKSKIYYDVVEWLIKDPVTISTAKKYKFYSNQDIIDNPDGTLTIKLFHVNNLPAIAKYLAQWGGNIIPIAPTELKDEYRKLLNDCLVSIPK